CAPWDTASRSANSMDVTSCRPLSPRRRCGGWRRETRIKAPRLAELSGRLLHAARPAECHAQVVPDRGFVEPRILQRLAVLGNRRLELIRVNERACQRIVITGCVRAVGLKPNRLTKFVGG